MKSLLVLLLLSLPGVSLAAQDAAPAPAEAQPTYPSRSFGLFGNVDYAGAGSTGRGFNIGQLTLQYTSALAPRVLVFSEVTYSPNAAAGTEHGHGSGYNLEVERLIARYDHSDHLKISLGRYRGIL